MDTAESRPISQLFSALGSQVKRLVATEVQLARAEVKENLLRTRGAVGMILAGAALVIPALTIFLQGIVNALVVAGVRADLSGLGIGVGTGVVSIVLIMVGLKKAKTVHLVPDKALSHVQRDFSAVNPMRSSHEHPTT